MSETEQNKTEDATPFKLKKAREKGQVAKGPDLGFFSTLVGLAIFMLLVGKRLVADLIDTMQRTYVTSIEQASDPSRVLEAIATAYARPIQSVALLGATVAIVVIIMEIIQIKGFFITFQPLKPDFTKLNPAKGLKKLFSMKMLKDTLKSIFKMSVYTGCTYLLILQSVRALAPNIANADDLLSSMSQGGMRMIYLYAALALMFAIIDQVIARKEFAKQMRMSTSEVKREHKDREGEPRMKKKRQQLHAEYIKQTQSTGALPGSDMLIVNPQHYAVALKYRPQEMGAPQVTTKGRNRFALLLKTEAGRRGIPIISDPPLARALFKSSKPGQTVPEKHFRAVAAKYINVRHQAGGVSDG